MTMRGGVWMWLGGVLVALGAGGDLFVLLFGVAVTALGAFRLETKPAGH